MAISRCGDVCHTAATPYATGNKFKKLQVFNVKVILDNTNTNPVATGSGNIFESIVAQDEARLWTGDLDAETGLDFMNG